MKITGVARINADNVPVGGVRFTAKCPFEWQGNEYVPSFKYTAMPGTDLMDQLSRWLEEDKIEDLEGR